MRAKEFIIEREEWYSMPTPTMQKQFDVWDQEKRGRNALTTMPLPRTTTNPGYRLGPDSPNTPPQDYSQAIRNPKVAKELGFPQGWTENDPTRLTTKMINPSTGSIQLGPDEIVLPGTEEYAQLRMRTNPDTSTIKPPGSGRLPKAGQEPPSKEHEKRSQREVPNMTRDKGKEATFPSDQPRGYSIGDTFRQKYRT